MKLKCVLFLTFLSISASFAAADNDEHGWTTFGESEDQKRFANCFMIVYPSSFSVDPASGITPSLSFRVLPVPEENLHNLILYNRDKSMKVAASSYGYLDEQLYLSRGFASPREVILTNFFRSALLTSIRRMHNYDLIYSSTDVAATAIFLDRNAKWGFCYQSLTFSFHNGTTLRDHQKVVEEIVAKFVPSFARN